MSICGLLCQSTGTKKNSKKRTSAKMNWFSPWFSWQNVNMALCDTYQSLPITFCNLNITGTLLDVKTRTPSYILFEWVYL